MNKPENGYANDVEGSDERKMKDRKKKKQMPLGIQINDNCNYTRINGNVWA